MTAAPLTIAARDAEARAGLSRLLAGVPTGEGMEPWSPADIIRLWALVQLGRPAEVVTRGPAVVIAKGDTRGGRNNMPGESLRASVLHAWREVGRACGEPLPGPHEARAGGADSHGAIPGGLSREAISAVSPARSKGSTSGR